MQRYAASIRTSNITKRLIRSAITTLLCTVFSPHALALPTDGQIANGSANIEQNGRQMIIRQTSDKLGINWQNFTIAADEHVRFIQPSAQSIALNRILGSNASTIYGQLSANGSVFLINPNGILFAPGSQVSVGSLTASSLSISDTNFRNGNFSFDQRGTAGAVVNQGRIEAAPGGYIALLAPQVRNEGILIAQSGTVALAGASQTTLDLSGDGLLRLTVNKDALAAQVSNKNLIQADGGQVIMTAKASTALRSTVVNNDGIIRARSLQNRNGSIRLDGDANGIVSNSGILDASGLQTGQSGGSIAVLGDLVTLSADSTLDASGYSGGGRILVGGNLQGSGSERTASATTVAASAQLRADAIQRGNGGTAVVWSNQNTQFSGSISARGGKESGNGGFVETSGKNYLSMRGRVTAAATHGSGGTWLLDPCDVTIGSSTSNSTFANGSPTATFSPTTAPSTIDAQAVSAALAGNHVIITTGASGSQAGNITVSNDVNWNTSNTLTLKAAHDITVNAALNGQGGGSVVLRADSGGSGSGTVSFGTGGVINLGGSGAKAVSIYYNPSSYATPHNYASNIHGATSLTSYMLVNNMSQLQAINTNLSGTYALGCDLDASALNHAGWNGGAGFEPLGQNSAMSDRFSGVFDGNGHSITGLYIHRNSDWVGLFGYTNNALIRNVSLRNMDIYGSSYVGGLIGYNDSLQPISNISSSGSVTAASGPFAGGLFGVNNGSALNTLSSTATVRGIDNVGGLTGDNNRSSLNDGHFSGAVISNGQYAGGIAGRNNNGAVISNSSNSGSVSGITDVGGISGLNHSGSIVRDSSNSGAVTGSGTTSGSTMRIGGLVGFNDIGSSITDSSNSGTVTLSLPTDTDYGGVGGIAGVNDGALSLSTISACYNSGSVNGVTNSGGIAGLNTNHAIVRDTANSGAITATGSSENIGGLVGFNNQGLVDSSHSQSAVSATGQKIGGLVGFNNGSTIRNSYSGGSVSSNNWFVGGLVGSNNSTISNCYSSSAVSGSAYTGGLLGASYGGTIDTAYSNGRVTSGGANVGGFIGRNDATIRNSYWDVLSSGQPSSAISTFDGSSAIGQTTLAMQTQATFAGWDFNAVWGIAPGASPILRKNLKITVSDSSRSYGDSNPGFTAAFSGFDLGDTSALRNALTITTTADTHSAVGNYLLVGSVSQPFYQYNLSYQNGSLSVTPRTVYVTPTTGQGKVYGTVDPSLHYSVTNLAIGDSLNGSLARQAGDAIGTYLISQNTLSNANNPNYDIRFSIAPAYFTIAAPAATPDRPIDALSPSTSSASALLLSGLLAQKMALLHAPLSSDFKNIDRLFSPVALNLTIFPHPHKKIRLHGTVIIPLFTAQPLD